RASLLAVAEVDFDDDASGVIGHDQVTGHTALAMALGPDDDEPVSGLQLDRFPGRSIHRTANPLRPALDEHEGAVNRPPARRIGPADGEDFGHAHEQHARELQTIRERHTPTQSQLGAWTLVRGTTADTLDDLLTPAEEETP